MQKTTSIKMSSNVNSEVPIRKCWNDLLVSNSQLFETKRKRCFILNQEDCNNVVDDSEVLQCFAEIFGSEENVIVISDGFIFPDNEKAKLAESKLLKKFPGTKWQVLPKIVPPVHECGFLLKSGSAAQLDEINQLLRHQSDDKSMQTPEVNHWKGSFRVMYPNDADVSDLKLALGKKKFKDKPLLVGEFCHSDCIRVGNLTGKVTSDDIKQAICSVERCRITHVEMNRKTALVYFANYEDASLVIKKLRTSKHTQATEALGNPKVIFNLYYHHATEKKQMTTLSKDSERNPLKEVLQSQPPIREQESLATLDPLTQALPDTPTPGQKPKKNVWFVDAADEHTDTKSFELTPDEPDCILELVHHSSNLGKMLDAKFKTVKAEVIPKAKSKTNQEPVKYVVKITLCDEEKVVENYMLDGAIFKEKCLKRARDFFSEFVTKSEKFDFDRLSDFRFKMGWDRSNESVVAMKTEDGVAVDVYASWSNVDKGKVNVTGLQADVDAVLTKLKNATANLAPLSQSHSCKQRQQVKSVSKVQERCSVKLGNHVSGWFYKFAGKSESCGNLFEQVEIKISEDKDEIYLYGPQQECVRAKHWIVEMADQLAKVKHEVTDELEAYLETSQGKRRLSEVESRTNCSMSIGQVQSSQILTPPSQTVPGLILCTRKLKDSDVTVRVIQVDITQMPCDAIVNASNSQLHLRSGGVSGCILRKGGRSIQQEMEDIIRWKRFLPVGDAVTTGAGILPCRKIIHAVGPTWYGRSHNHKETERSLMRCVTSILREAQSGGLSSIAIPAISCGVFGGDSDKCTSLIVEAIVEYFAAAYNSCIKRIDLVELYDEYTLFLFKQALEIVSTPQDDDPFLSTQDTMYQAQLRQSMNKSQSSSIKIGPVTVCVKLGDVTNERCDAIVNPMAPGYRFDLGVVSRAILSRGGKQIERQCHSHLQKTKAFPDFRVTGSGNLPCGYIFHLLIPLQRDSLVFALAQMLRDADQRQMQTLAMPAIGTGSLALSIKDCTKIIKQAIENVTSTGVTNLREIRIVIFDLKNLENCQEALCSDEMNEGFSSNRSYSKNLGSKTVQICGKSNEDVKKAWMMLKAGPKDNTSDDDESICEETITLSSEEGWKYDDDIFALQDECNVSFEIVIRRKETILKVGGKRRDVEKALGLVKRVVGQKRLRPTDKETPNMKKYMEQGESHSTLTHTEYAIDPFLDERSTEKYPARGFGNLYGCGRSDERDAFASTSNSEWNYNANNSTVRTTGEFREFGPTKFGNAVENNVVSSHGNKTTSRKNEEVSAARKENSERNLQKLRSAQGRKWRDKKREEQRTQPHTNLNLDRQISGGAEWRNWEFLQTQNWVLEELARGSDQYKKIVGCFTKGSTFLKTVKSVEKVKNPKLFQKFEREKRGTSYGRDDNTVEMYYGVKYEGRSKYICQNGWNSEAELRSRPGQGATFQASSAMAVSDAARDSQGCRRMFLAYVIKGQEYTTNDPHSRSAVGSTRQCDSVVNTHGNTRTVFKNSSAYPAYLLTFKAY